MRKRTPTISAMTVKLIMSVLVLLAALAIPLDATSAAATQDTPSSRPESGFVGAVDPSSIIITTVSGWALADVVGDAPVTQRGRYLLIDVAPGQTPQEAVATWTGRPGVETASVRYRYEMSGQVVPAAVPNDPLYGDQPNFDAVQAPAAWDTSTGAGSVVAVVDTGVSPGNDLACHTFVSEYDAVLDLAGPGIAYDEFGHGTHVTGTVAQCTDNGIGVAGIAPNATVMPINVFYSDGYTTTEILAMGIDWAVDHGADIITMSLGFACGGLDFADCQDPTINAAIARAKAADLLVVAASGNESEVTENYPANHPDVMGIGAVNINNVQTFYSNSGPGLSIVAPGGDGLKGILQQTFVFDGSGIRVFDYYYYEGTSMATPHVAGAAAILRAVAPCASAAEVRSALEGSALDLGAPGVDNLYGAGLLQINSALDALHASGASTGACANWQIGTARLSPEIISVGRLTIDMRASGDNATSSGFNIVVVGYDNINPRVGRVFDADGNFGGPYTGVVDNGLRNIILAGESGCSVGGIDVSEFSGSFTKWLAFRTPVVIDQTGHDGARHLFQHGIRAGNTSEVDQVGTVAVFTGMWADDGDLVAESGEIACTGSAFLSTNYVANF